MKSNYKQPKLIVTFDDAHRPQIVAKNCTQADFYAVSSKLLANAKTLPKKRNLTFFKRLSKAVKYACSRTSVEKCQVTK